ncbi:hypothetical protein BC629DRAFT_919207 [Irpex lacteus]|nr:hypothetical protein BC629DRAFT_919207 [Irpex lacteus]
MAGIVPTVHPTHVTTITEDVRRGCVDGTTLLWMPLKLNDNEELPESMQGRDWGGRTMGVALFMCFDVPSPRHALDGDLCVTSETILYWRGNCWAKGRLSRNHSSKHPFLDRSLVLDPGGFALSWVNSASLPSFQHAWNWKNHMRLAARILQPSALAEYTKMVAEPAHAGVLRTPGMDMTSVLARSIIHGSLQSLFSGFQTTAAIPSTVSRVQSVSRSIHHPKQRGFPLLPADVERLTPGRWLNDSVVDASILVLLDTLAQKRPEMRKQIFVFSSFFYKSKNEGYKYVSKWTKKIDLFAQKYVLFPLYHTDHWFLIIICNPRFLLHRYGTDTLAHILVLDSLSWNHKNDIAALTTYLQQEAKSKLNEDVQITSNNPTVKYVPRQTNGIDCGVYLIHFIETFLCDPDVCAGKILTKNVEDWPVQQIDVNALREGLRTRLAPLIASTFEHGWDSSDSEIEVIG